MQIPDEMAAQMLSDPGLCEHFVLPVTNRAQTALWQLLNTCLLTLRMPLYYRRLGKKPPKPADYARATQQALCLLTAFARAAGTRQVICSATHGYIRSISFQPRPLDMNWTSQHAISPANLVFSHHSEDRMSVTYEDIFHLTAKLIYVVSGHNSGELPDATGTIIFGAGRIGGLHTLVVVRELNGPVHRAMLK